MSGEASWVSDVFRSLFGLIDGVIFGFINTVYVTFTNISSYTIMSNEMIKAFSERIYALLGVFMLFKLTFSLINYFVDPDKFNDKSAGFSKLVQRTIISLVILICVPTIFNLAMRVQTIVLNQNILANLILGGDYTGTDVDPTTSKESRVNVYKNAGKSIGFESMRAFIHPYRDDFLVKEAELDDKEKKVKDEYSQAIEDKSISELIQIKNRENEDGDYIFKYVFGISTICGIIIVWVLLTFCIDIGIRSVKLTFLQLIAPIPVLSYIDPKNHKAWDSWVKECTSTYIGLFIRLIAIYFVVYIISILTSGSGGVFTFFKYKIGTDGKLTQTVVSDPDWFAAIFIIVGLLLFAKEIPSLLENMLGTKFNGNFKRNSGFLKTGIGAAVGGVAGGAIGAYMGVKNTKFDEEKPLKSGLNLFKNGAKYAATGLTGGGYRTFKNKGNVLTGLKATANARNLSQKSGIGWRSKLENKISDVTGKTYSGGTTDTFKNELKLLQAQKANAARDEHAYSDSIANYKSKNPNKILAFDEAFKTRVNGIDKDTGAWNYELDWKYKDANGNNVDFFGADESKRLEDVDFAKYQEYAKKAGLTDTLSAKEFETMRRLTISRNDADNEGHKMDKKITQLQENLDKMKGSKK